MCESGALPITPAPAPASIDFLPAPPALAVWCTNIVAALVFVANRLNSLSSLDMSLLLFSSMSSSSIM